jgi:hypothetical protein
MKLFARQPQYRIRSYSADYMERTNWFAVIHRKVWSWHKVGTTQQAQTEDEALAKATSHLAQMRPLWDSGKVKVH